MEAKRMTARVDEVECPHCQEMNGGWMIDPRGVADSYECDGCGKKFTVSSDIKIEIGA